MPGQRLSAEQRRERILEASLDVFAAKGFSGARTKQIAKAAGVSETLIFQHFRSKEELYVEALRYLCSPHPIMPELEPSMARDDDHGVLFSYARHVIDESRKDPRIVRMLMYSGLEGQHRAIEEHSAGDIPERESSEEALIGYIGRRMGAGAFKSLNPELVAKAFLYMVYLEAADHHLRLTGEPSGLSVEETAETLVEVFLNGIRA